MSTASAGDLYVTRLADDDESGSLRAAIVDANEDPDSDTIHFNVLGTIYLTKNLPIIVYPVIIDGEDKITLDGSDHSGKDYCRALTCGGTPCGYCSNYIQNGQEPPYGLCISGANNSGAPEGSVVKNLVVQNLCVGIAAENANDITVEKVTFINNDGNAGLDIFEVNNAVLKQNTFYDHRYDSLEVAAGFDNRVTGAEISGNTITMNEPLNNLFELGDGMELIRVDDSKIHHNNFITTVQSFRQFYIQLGNSNEVFQNYFFTADEAQYHDRYPWGAWTAIAEVNAQNSHIHDNVIIGPSLSGIWGWNERNALIENNLIMGTTLAGVYYGTLFFPGINNRENTIRFNEITNAGTGVLIGRHPCCGVRANRDNAIYGNSIYGNAGLGIDLTDNDTSGFVIEPDGVTLNDLQDRDLGPNNLQNYPVLNWATLVFSDMNAHGHLHSEPNKQYLLEFFLNSVEARQGEMPIHTLFVTTDEDGNAPFEVAGVPLPLPPEELENAYLTSTATEVCEPNVPNDGDCPHGFASTSEFSAPRLIKTEIIEDDQTEGTNGDDELIGDLGANLIFGLAGNDILWGNNPENNGDPNSPDAGDEIHGGAGDDIIYGNQGEDFLVGGTGADTIFGGRQDDEIDGGDGADHLEGNQGDDEIDGGEGMDVIFGGLGADTAYGGEGNDIIYGNDPDNNGSATSPDGNDILFGNEGDDLIFGNQGEDELFGGEGDDTVFGGRDDDFIAGNAGNDNLFGNQEDDMITGGFGNDAIAGGLGMDIISGGADDDIIYGNDAVSNGSETSPDGADILFGDSGNDTLFGNQDDDILSGGDGNDILYGGRQDDWLEGNAGDDLVFGNHENDLVYWTVGDGRDFVDGGEGTDNLMVLGSADDETYFIETPEAYFARLGEVDPTIADETEIVVSRAVDGEPSVILAELVNMEDINVDGNGGNDMFVITGDFSDSNLDEDTITLVGSAGHDTVDTSGLTSEHSVLFKSNGGDDMLFGELSHSDVIELAPDTVATEYNETDDGNTVTLSNGEHSVTYASGSEPTVQEAP